MKYLQDVLLPKLEGFSKDIEFYNTSLNDCRKATATLDENLTLKANKANFNVFIENCLRNFINKEAWTGMEQEFQKLQAKN